MNDPALHLDALIIGGGIAGLWTLHELRARGRLALLVEPFSMGQGQTIWSQGIIHGGLKYTLGGLMNASAEALREMPAIWRECLTGRRSPSIPADGLRAECCYLWRTKSLSSQAGMIGARMGLRVAPVPLSASERPPILRDCPGTVARLDEQVIDPAVAVQALSEQCPGLVRRVDPARGLEIGALVSGELRTVTLRPPGAGRALTVQPDRLVFTAGAGNGFLREQVGLGSQAMQIRPLHMTLLRDASPDGDRVPELNGHCVDGARTRVTITSAMTAAGRRVWQIGGEMAERGVSHPPEEVVAMVRNELRAVLPGFDSSGCEWTTYRADRAEAVTGAARRPDDCTVRVEGDVITAWPTKLALAPRMAGMVADVVCRNPEPVTASADELLERLDTWPVPSVGAPAWEMARSWIADSAVR